MHGMINAKFSIVIILEEEVSHKEDRDSDQERLHRDINFKEIFNFLS